MPRRRVGNIGGTTGGQFILTAARPRQLICARCNAAFVCGAGGRDGRCWCAEETYRVPMPLSADEDCLCPSCLRAHAEKSEAKAPR